MAYSSTRSYSSILGPKSSNELDKHLQEVDIAYFKMSVRERIQAAVRTKEQGNCGSRYFYEEILETADEFLVESQNETQNKLRYDEVKKASTEMEEAFPVIKKYVGNNRELDLALLNVMWNSFLIGLACDRQGLDRSDADQLNADAQGELMRQGQQKYLRKLEVLVKRAAEHETPKHPKMARPPKSRESALILRPYVASALGVKEEDVGVGKLVAAIGRIWPPLGLRGPKPGQKKPKTKKIVRTL